MPPLFTFQIGRIRRALYREFEQRVEEFGLTAPQYQVLNRLWEGEGILISELVSDISSDGATVTGILDRLECRGLVRRERDDGDRRKIYLYLTDEGRKLKCPVQSLLFLLNEQALHGLSPEERLSMTRLLDRVESNLKL